MELRDILRELRIEAMICEQSASNNGEYNQAFRVASIVLANLARRLEAASRAIGGGE